MPNSKIDNLSQDEKSEKINSHDQDKKQTPINQENTKNTQPSAPNSEAQLKSERVNRPVSTQLPSMFDLIRAKYESKETTHGETGRKNFDVPKVHSVYTKKSSPKVIVSVTKIDSTMRNSPLFDLIRAKYESKETTHGETGRINSVAHQTETSISAENTVQTATADPTVTTETAHQTSATNLTGGRLQFFAESTSQQPSAPENNEEGRSIVPNRG